jgi:cardiolipin synthase (CMP-forming)
MAAEPAGAGEDRILTVPNVITLVRLACIPVFVVLLARGGRSEWFPAALLLGAVSATDSVDGFVARRFAQVSSLGKVLDPLADRLLIVTAAVAIVAVGAVPLAIAVIALAREVFVGSGFLVVAIAGGRRMDVSRIGKAATLALMTALPLYLTGHSTVGWHRGAEDLAWVCAVPGLVLGWYSAISYVPRARRAVAEGKATKAQGEVTRP